MKMLKGMYSQINLPIVILLPQSEPLGEST